MVTGIVGQLLETIAPRNQFVVLTKKGLASGFVVQNVRFQRIYKYLQTKANFVSKNLTLII